MDTGTVGLFLPPPDDGIVWVVCWRCKKFFRAVPDSPAHKASECQRCYDFSMALIKRGLRR